MRKKREDWPRRHGGRGGKKGRREGVKEVRKEAEIRGHSLDVEQGSVRGNKRVRVAEWKSARVREKSKTHPQTTRVGHPRLKSKRDPSAARPGALRNARRRRPGRSGRDDNALVWVEVVEEWKSKRVEECKSSRVREWKSKRVEECKSVRVQEYESARV
jgi:hypothetical protein